MEHYPEMTAVLIAYLLDLLIGDPLWLPHPIVAFGWSISKGEKLLNKGNHRLVKGALMSIGLIAFAFVFFYALMWVSDWLHPLIATILTGLFFFFGIANRTLIKEGLDVFKILDKDGLEAGRKQLSRIVGRDTSELSPQQIRTAVLETMAENLSDGVVAPLFWFAIAGIPGMMTYKMINTLDSMIAYKNERYLYFGRVAAYIDDAANYIPARLTAFIMALAAFAPRAVTFIFQFGKKHSSPNAGYPEAALAGILNCRFGGPNVYHGQLVNKPHIGIQDQTFYYSHIKITSRINHAVCLFTIILILISRYFL
ncbi:MAG: cobalamin biosynthesis protein CobD [Marinilabiliaceae bacterium]|nr:cobalamin biosynthesis protein CobD [Marinilabiliaceae bacterium]